ncbi:MAG: hypothetical protein V4722_28405 [Bacteroidota bacterium]
MKTIFIIISSCLIISSCSNKVIPSTTPVTNQLGKDSKGVPMLLGHCTPSSMQQLPFSKWYDSAFKAHQPNAEQVAVLQQNLKETEIEIFLGTWCGDSKREVPRLLKTLSQSGFDTANIRLIMVDHEGVATKASPQHEENGKNIFRVPTAIVYQNKKEIGRIIESPVESWEKDLVKVTTHQPYISNYHAANEFSKQLKNKNADDATLAKMAEQYKPQFKSSASLNSLGYLLLNQKQTSKAFQAFRLNTLLFPEDSNVWDSLAEAYANTGDKTKAVELYKKVLDMKPGNTNAAEQIKKLSE